MAIRVTNENFEEDVLKAKIPTAVEFYSDSCIPCKQMAAVLGELEEEYEGKIKILKVNVSFSPELVEQYKVMAAPTIILFKAEKEVKRLVGLTKKAVLQEIFDYI